MKNQKEVKEKIKCLKKVFDHYYFFSLKIEFHLWATIRDVNMSAHITSAPYGLHISFLAPYVGAY